MKQGDFQSCENLPCPPNRASEERLASCFPHMLCLSLSRHGDGVYVCLAGRIQRWKSKPGWTRAGSAAGIPLCSSAGDQSTESQRALLRLVIQPAVSTALRKKHEPPQLLQGLFMNVCFPQAGVLLGRNFITRIP